MQYKFLNSLFLAANSLIAATTFTACTMDESVNVTKNKIVLGVTDHNIYGGHEAKTRGVLTQSGDIKSFGLSATAYPASDSYSSAECGSYFHNLSVTPGTPLEYYWPTSDYKMSFYGYYPMDNQNFKMISSATTKGLPAYEYTVPADVTEQADVMTGAIIDEKGGEHPSPLNMVFQHRLADISFSVHNTASEPMTFKSLTFMGLKYHGTLNDDAWTITGDRNTESTSPFVLAPNAIIDADATASITESNTHMMMIPQTIPSGTTILKVNLAIGDKEQEFEYTLEKDMTFSSGKSYNICLEAGETYIIINAEDTSINDWEAEEKDLSIGGVSTDDEWSQPSINGNGDVTIKDWEKE